MDPVTNILPPPDGGFIISQHISRGDPLLAYARFDLSNYDDTLCERWELPLPVNLQKAVKKRRAEFVASRFLVRDVLSHVGTHGFLLNNRPDRSPIWPSGVQGSLSHTDGTVALAITKQPLCIGIDVEQVMGLDTAVETADVLMSSEERALLSALPLPFPLAATLLFSLKESLYKALWPRLCQPMDFHQASLVDIDLLAQKARLCLNDDFSAAFNCDTRLNATFRVESDRVLTLVTHPIEDDKKPA